MPYLQESWDSLKRIPKELRANLAELAATYGPAAAELGAGMLPGAGQAQAWQDYGEAGKQLQEGNYLGAAGNYAQGAFNQVFDMHPALAAVPTLKIASKASRGERALVAGDRLAGPVHGGPDVTVPGLPYSAQPDVPAPPRRPEKPPTSTTTFGGKTWQPERGTIQGDNPEYAEVLADVKKVDADFAKDRDMYVGPGGEGQIRTRYPDFAKWHAENPDTPVIMPRVGLTDAPSSRFAFGNGRHRFAYMRDQGVEAIPMTVNRENADVFRERYGYVPPEGLPAAPRSYDVPPEARGPVTPTPENQAQLRGMYEPTTELLPDKVIGIEDLQGKAMIPVPGDRTQAGQRLIGVDGQRFANPVDLQGGRNFARAEAAQGPDASGWASTASGAKPLHSRTQRVADETGLDPVWAYMPLSEKSSDFTRLGWRTYDQLLQGRGGEEAMKAIAKDMPFGASLDEMRKWYEGASGGERSTAFKKLATKGRMGASGIDPNEVRGLIADPGLARAKEGDIGYGFINPAGTITGNAAIPHQDYSHHLGGTYAGRFAEGTELPFSQAFPDAFVKNPSWHNLPVQGVSHGIKTQMPYQIVDQQMVDRVKQLQELRQRYGDEYLNVPGLGGGQYGR